MSADLVAIETAIVDGLATVRTTIKSLDNEVTSLLTSSEGLASHIEDLQLQLQGVPERLNTIVSDVTSRLSSQIETVIIDNAGALSGQIQQTQSSIAEISQKVLNPQPVVALTTKIENQIEFTRQQIETETERVVSLANTFDETINERRDTVIAQLDEFKVNLANCNDALIAEFNELVRQPLEEFGDELIEQWELALTGQLEAFIQEQNDRLTEFAGTFVQSQVDGVRTVIQECVEDLTSELFRGSEESATETDGLRGAMETLEEELPPLKAIVDTFTDLAKGLGAM